MTDIDKLEPTPHDRFQVGDRIKCHNDKPKYKDRLGVVHKLNPDICLVTRGWQSQNFPVSL